MIILASILLRGTRPNRRHHTEDETMTKMIITACVTALLAGATLTGTSEPASAGNKYCKGGNKGVEGYRPGGKMRCIENRCPLIRPLSGAAKARAASRAVHGRH